LSCKKDRGLDWMIDAYARGMSCGHIAQRAGVTRQSVFEILRRRGCEFRKRGRKIRADEVLRYGGLVYTWSNKGYWRCTTGSRNNLIREIWESAHRTKLPPSTKVHFRDGDRTNVEPSNLVAMTDSEFMHIRQQIPEVRDMSRACLCVGTLVVAIMRATDPDFGRAISERMWKTRREKYSPAEISAQSKKSHLTRKLRYGTSEVKDPSQHRNT